MHHVMMEPTLDTKRLYLRPLRLDDLSWHHALIHSDPEVTWDGTSAPIAQTLKALERRLKHWRTYGFGMWAVVEKQTNTELGFAGLQYLEDSGEVEVGYYLGRPSWGQGYATEAGRAIIHHGFEVLGLPRVVAVARRENAASQRVLAKLGLRYLCDEEHYGFMVQLWEVQAEDFKRPA